MPLSKNARIALFLLFLSVAANSVECQHLLDNFRTIEINPTSLTVKLDGLLPFLSSQEHDFYQRVWINSGISSIDHLGPTGSNIRYNGFLLDSDGRLITRSKSQVLMHGPYGTVFAQSTYYYGQQYNHQPTDFHVELYFNEGSYEPAQQVEMVNDSGELSAISVVRVIRAPPEFLVACATYDATGRLLVLSVNGSKNGNWVHSTEVAALYPALDFGTIYEDRPKTREYFGLEEIFPIADYLKSPENKSPQGASPTYSDVVTLHYQKNRYVRQDIFQVDGTHTTGFFKYAITPEDRQLEAVDRQIRFGR